MWALRLHGPTELRIEQLPERPLAPHEARLAPQAVGICGTDLEIYHGTMVYFTSGLAGWPLILGHEWSAEVLEVGAAVTNVRPGDRVVGECTVACGQCDMCRRGCYNVCPNRQETGILHLDGACAERMIYPASSLHRFHGLSYAEAALTEPTAVAVRAVKTARVSPGDRVVILGAGTIGLLALQVARAYGARQVVLVEPQPHRRRLALELGADGVIDPRGDDLLAQAQLLSAGQLFDVVVEASGNPRAVPQITRLVGAYGRVCLIGLFSSQPAAVDMDTLVVRNVQMYGSLGSPAVWPETIDLLERGLVRTKPLITHRFGLDQAANAFALMQSAADDCIKILLLPQAGDRPGR